MAQTAAQKKAAETATMEGQYQFVTDLVGSIPELASLVKKASAEGATSDAFSAMLQQTKWWRTNADAAKQYVALSASDPAEYKQRVSQATDHVKQMASGLGINLTAAQLKSYATTDLYQGLSDEALKAQLGSNFTAQANGVNAPPATGDIAQYQQQLNALASAYGVPVTKSWSNGLIQSALTGGQTLDEMLAGARSSLINSAKSAYPTLAAQLDAGQTTTDIAQPYIAAMSQVLEVPDSGIQVTDPTIQKALTNSSLLPAAGGSSKPMTPGVANTNPAPVGAAPAASSAAGATTQPGASTMPLWQFQNQLRADPRWQQTDNAKQSAYSMVASLGKQWGFAS